jgi:hypothetical protein
MGRWWGLCTPIVCRLVVLCYRLLSQTFSIMFVFLMQECHNWTVPIKFYRILSFANWIVEAACALTHDDDSVLCPELACPPDNLVLGYPRAEIPDATARIKTFREFQPARVAQSPPAGTPFNTSTKVLVMRVDAPNRVGALRVDAHLP